MKLNVLVGEIMTKDIKRIDASDTIEKAAKIMRDNRIGSVVVMSEKNIKGIVTTSDIVYKHVAGKKDGPISSIMTENIIHIAPNAIIEDAARMLVKNNIEKLLVYDRGSLVGIITNNDIIRVEPAIIEILMEREKMGKRIPSDVDIGECESCGNFSDSLEQQNGVFLCQECRS